MNPVLFTFGPLVVRWYGAMMAAGFLAALTTWTRLGRRTGFDAAFCSDILMWIMISGIVGARIAYVAASWQEYASHPLDALSVWKGGLVFYGGFIGAGIAMAIMARIRHVPFLEFIDLVVTGLPIGHAFGRIGCFVNHCCFGHPYNGVCSVVDPETGLRVHPTQLYEAGLNVLIYAILLIVYRRRERRGDTIVAYLLTYPVARFLLEYTRGDPRLHTGALTLAQTTSVALFLLGWVMLYMKRPLIKPED